jgi:hypothetical protein
MTPDRRQPELRKGYFAFGTDQVIVIKNTAPFSAVENAGKPAPSRTTSPRSPT